MFVELAPNDESALIRCVKNCDDELVKKMYTIYKKPCKRLPFLQAMLSVQQRIKTAQISGKCFTQIKENQSIGFVESALFKYMCYLCCIFTLQYTSQN